MILHSEMVRIKLSVTHKPLRIFNAAKNHLIDHKQKSLSYLCLEYL